MYLAKVVLTDEEVKIENASILDLTSVDESDNLIGVRLFRSGRPTETYIKQLKRRARTAVREGTYSSHVTALNALARERGAKDWQAFLRGAIETQLGFDTLYDPARPTLEF